MANEEYVEGVVQMDSVVAEEYKPGETLAASNCDAKVEEVKTDGEIRAKALPDSIYCGDCILNCNVRFGGGETMFISPDDEE